MFKRRHDGGEPVVIEIDGVTVEARAGESVAAAVLAHLGGATRTTPVTGADRAPYCMMGVCFDCLMEIDGVPNRQACMVTVAPGMTVAHQMGARRAGDGDGA